MYGRRGDTIAMLLILFVLVNAVISTLACVFLFSRNHKTDVGLIWHHTE